jgi:hypothetical protein
MAKYAVKFAKGQPSVIDADGNAVPGSVVLVLNFREGPVPVIEGRRWGPQHRPTTADIRVDGREIRAVPVQTLRKS